MPNSTRRLLVAALLTATLAPLTQAAPQFVTILAQQDVLDDYSRFLHGRDPLTIQQYGGPGSRRDVAELVLVQQALKRGGLNYPVKIVSVDRSSDSYNRYLREILSGTATVGGNTAWEIDLKDIRDQVFVSPALIANGEFEAGLYTSPDNTRALNAKTLADIQKLTAVVADSWKPDVATLQSLGMKQLLMTQSWDSMVGMVSKQRADVMLAPFQANDSMSLVTDKHRFVPIPNVKVGLSGSRHLFVSRRAPLGQETADALARGLAKLREEGTIRRAYTEAGFFNSRAASWHKINP
ncbi:hypothetical protein ACTSKR_05925 [Chitinibacteraceae bacterium HSL-7]